MNYSVFKSDGVWKHFLRSSDAQGARCKLCPNGKIIKCAGGSTSGLRNHLKTQHPEREPEPSPKPSLPPAKKIKTLDEHFEPRQPTLEYRLARMAAKDGLSFKTLAESDDIQNLLRSQHENVPRSRRAIQTKVNAFAQSVIVRVKEEVRARKNAETKFCISMDEWTSLRNRRYLNLCLHDFNQNRRVFYRSAVIR